MSRVVTGKTKASCSETIKKKQQIAMLSCDVYLACCDHEVLASCTVTRATLVNLSAIV